MNMNKNLLVNPLFAGILLVVLFSAFDFGWYSVVISNAVCLLPLCIAQYIAIRKELKLIREDKK